MHDAREICFFCPTDYEVRAVRRATGLPSSQIIRTGPGADAIRRTFDGLTIMPSGVILTGFAAGLQPPASSGGVYAVERVMAPDGRRVDAPWVIDRLERVSMISVPEPLRTVGEKRTLALRSGAVLADLEGFTFASESARRKWRWAIVRAVFDGPNDTPPQGMESLVRPDGRSRWLRSILWSFSVLRQGQQARSLMQNAAVGLQRLALAAQFAATPTSSEERD